MNNPTTMPNSQLELLRQEKARLKQLCHEKEEALNQNFHYLSDNAGDIIVNTLCNAAQAKIATLFTPSSQEKVSTKKKSANEANNIASDNIVGIAYNLIKQNLTAGTIFKLARPIITTLIIRKIKKLFKH